MRSWRSARGTSRGFPGTSEILESTRKVRRVRRLEVALVLLVAAISFGATPGPTPAVRPNFVVVLADDLGFADLGSYGSEIDTPNLDQLAERGLRFTHFYTTPKCETTRRSLLTGLYFAAAPRNLARRNPRSKRRYVSAAEVLHDAGYATFAVGKWHLAGTPLEFGFDHYFGHLSGSTDSFAGNATYRLDAEPYAVPEAGFYATDAETDWAIRFVEEAHATRKPFFLYLAYGAPHSPLQAPRADVEKYLERYAAGWEAVRARRHERQVELGITNDSWTQRALPLGVPPWETLDAEQRALEALRMAAYAGMVDRLDRNVGRLVDKLDSLGVRENTVILFLSDNGPSHSQRQFDASKPPWEPGSFLTLDAGWATASNTPFRGFKRDVFEGGIASPLIVHWPAGIREGGGLVTEVSHVVDIVPTLIDLAGVSHPSASRAASAKRLPLPPRGRSLVPAFTGGSLGARSIYWHFSKHRAIRRGKWKLLSINGGKWRLYDLEADRSETREVAWTPGGPKRELRKAWKRWARSAGVGKPKKSR